MLSWGEADNAIDIGRKVSDLLKSDGTFCGEILLEIPNRKGWTLEDVVYNRKGMESCFLMKNHLPWTSSWGLLLVMASLVQGFKVMWQKSYTVTDLGSWLSSWWLEAAKELWDKQYHPQVIHDLFKFLALGIQYAWYTRYIASWF